MENLDPNLHQPGRGDELLFLLLLPGDEVQEQSRNTDTAGRRTRWCERRTTDRKCTAVVCGFQKPPQCLQAERGRGSVSMDNWRAEPSTGVRLVNQSTNTAPAQGFKCCYRERNLYSYSGKDHYALVCGKKCCPLAMQNSAQHVLWRALNALSKSAGAHWEIQHLPSPCSSLLAHQQPCTLSPWGCAWPWLGALHVPGAQAVARKSYLCTNNAAGEGLGSVLTLAHVWLLQHILCSPSEAGLEGLVEKLPLLILPWWFGVQHQWECCTHQLNTK